MTRRNDLLSYAPITVLCLVMSFFYLILMIALVPPLDSNAEGVPVNSYYPGSDVVNLVIVNVLFFMALISFVRASFTNPGTVPGIHPWDPESPASYGESSAFEKALYEKGFFNVRGLEKKMDGRARFCRLCGRYKPDRAHHSSNMGSCILEMDHYCPWIRNCVGYFNKKYFFLLVMYSSSALIAYCVALAPRFLHAVSTMGGVLDFFVVFSWILGAMLGAVVTSFCIFHMWLMAKAYTTIEFCEKRRADESKKTAHGQALKDLYKTSPYNVGVYKNICHVLGPWYLWLLPTRAGMPNDATAGCVFDVDLSHPMYASLGPNEKVVGSGTSITQSQKQEHVVGTDYEPLDMPREDVPEAIVTEQSSLLP